MYDQEKEDALYAANAGLFNELQGTLEPKVENQEKERKYGEHDCHATSEDGCAGCPFNRID